MCWYSSLCFFCVLFCMCVRLECVHVQVYMCVCVCVLASMYLDGLDYLLYYHNHYSGILLYMYIPNYISHMDGVYQ